MSFFGLLARAFKQAKKDASDDQIARRLTDDPITIELIAKVAKDYGYHFEIVQPDGNVLRFYKRQGEPTQDGSGVW